MRVVKVGSPFSLYGRGRCIHNHLPESSSSGYVETICDPEAIWFRCRSGMPLLSQSGRGSCKLASLIALVMFVVTGGSRRTGLEGSFVPAYQHLQ